MQCYSKVSEYKQLVAILYLILTFSFISLDSLKSQPWTDLVAVRYINLPKLSEPAANLSWLHTDFTYGFSYGSNVYGLNPSFEKIAAADGVPVYSLSLPLLFSHTWCDTAWKSVFIVIGRLNSDLKSITGDDYQAGFATIHSYHQSAKFKYKFGFYINTDYPGIFMLPLAGFDWKISERFLISTLLPTNFIAEIKLVPGKVHAGGIFRSFTKSFRYESGYYLSMRDNYSALFTDFYFSGSLVLNAEAGYSFFRNYKTGIRDGNITATGLSAPDGLMFRAALIYRLRRD
ncbi:MAG: DUF6268 family outer membrane beta-barrel protein [Bacteroidia bacterium]|nr:hypothetical protein [Bacteroidia bacterium]MCZ2277925.1 DUF6268 family outer membrane beta-barrel protein [Bacteroidia bacterium]